MKKIYSMKHKKLLALLLTSCLLAAESTAPVLAADTDSVSASAYDGTDSVSGYDVTAPGNVSDIPGYDIDAATDASGNSGYDAGYDTGDESSTEPTAVIPDEDPVVAEESASDAVSTIDSTDFSIEDLPETLTVSYSTHQQTYGWNSASSDGAVNGVTGKSKRAEALLIEFPQNTTLQELGISGDLISRGHVQSYGWLSYVNSGKICGTTGLSKRLEAVRIELTGTLADYYDVYYCTHSQSFGWLGWAKNGQSSGTAEYSYRLEAIRIIVQRKDLPVPGSSRNAFRCKSGHTHEFALNYDGTETCYCGEDIENASASISFSAAVNGTVYNEVVKNGTHYLLLPHSADLDTLQLQCKGSSPVESSSGTVDSAKRIIEGPFDNNTSVTVHFRNNQEESITILRSELPSLEIDLQNTTLSTIDNGSKDTKYPGNTLVLSADNEKYCFTDTDVEMKSRGNFSRTLDKKPYQIKLSAKVNVLGMGKARKWILLAQATDDSFMRNQLSLDIAAAMGLPYTPEGRSVNLFVDGEYRGLYLLCEKVEVGSSRVALENEYGVLCELDNVYYSAENHVYTTSVFKNHIVLKESKADDQDSGGTIGLTGFHFLQQRVDAFESALQAKNWAELYELVDMDSFARYYLLEEMIEDFDAVSTSCFLYMDGPDDKLHIGPVWDCDMTLCNVADGYYGTGTRSRFVENLYRTQFTASSWYTCLCSIEAFQSLVQETYNSYADSAISSVYTSIDPLEQELQQAADMNDILWNRYNGAMIYRHGHTSGTFTEEVAMLKTWYTERYDCLQKRYTSAPLLQYTAHQQTYGDISWSTDGETCGVYAHSKRIESISILLQNIDCSGGIEYRAHVQSIGWQGWKSNGQRAGTTGQSKRVEALQIRLTGEAAQHYDVYYRAYVQRFGWLDWAKNGESAGTSGYAFRMEAYQVVLAEKSADAPGATTNPFVSR